MFIMMFIMMLMGYESYLRQRLSPPPRSTGCCSCCFDQTEGLWGEVSRPSAAGIVFLAHHTERNDWAVYGEASTNPTGGTRIDATVRPRTHVYIFMLVWVLLSIGFTARFRHPAIIVMAVVVILTLAVIIKISQQGVRMYILQPLGIMSAPGSHGAGFFYNEAKEYTPLVVPGQSAFA